MKFCLRSTVAATIALVVVTIHLLVDGQTVPTVGMPPNRLLGCFSDPNGFGLSWTGTGFYIRELHMPVNKTAHCLNYCNFLGTRFAALSNSTCSCGVIYYPAKTVSNSSCNYTCSDGPACGGPGFASLYQLPLMPCTLDPIPNSTTTAITTTTSAMTSATGASTTNTAAPSTTANTTTTTTAPSDTTTTPSTTTTTTVAPSATTTTPSTTTTHHHTGAPSTTTTTTGAPSDTTTTTTTVAPSTTTTTPSTTTTHHHTGTPSDTTTTTGAPSTTTTTPSTTTTTTVAPSTTTTTTGAPSDTTTTPSTTTTTTGAPSDTTTTGAARDMNIQEEYVYEDIDMDYNYTSDRYYQFGNYCYRFELRTEMNANWTAAEQVCQSEGGHLVSIHSVIENNFVMSLAWSVGGAGWYPIIWGGAIDYHTSDVGNRFQWSDGTPLTYTNWRPNEPNSNFETCVQMFSNYPEPWKGTWNDIGCGVAQQFVCKRPGPPPAPNPNIEYLTVGNDYACGPTGTSYLAQSPYLEIWYSFDQANYVATGNYFTDLSGRNMVGDVVTLLPDGSLSRNVAPTFVSRGTNNDALLLNKTTIISTNHSFGTHTSAVSISCWTLQETSPVFPQARADIVTKYFSGFGGGSYNTYSLYVASGNSFCLAIGVNYVCATSTVISGSWQHVVGTFDGTRLEIYVDGQLSNSLLLPYPDNLNDFYSEPLVIGGRYNNNTIPQNTSFKGLIDDVRIYSELLTATDITYLARCSLGAPSLENGIVYMYEGNRVNIKVFGRNINDNQQIGIVPGSGCVNATIDYTNFPPLFMRTAYGSTTSAYVNLPANEISTKLANTNVLNMCVATPTSSIQYSADTGFDLVITRFDTLNGATNSTRPKVWIAGPNATATVTVSGVGFSQWQAVMLSQTTSCINGGILANWTVTSPTAATFSFTPFNQAIISDVFYICWLGGETQTANSPYFVPTGFSIDIDGPGYNYKRMASNNGNMGVDENAVNKGVALNSWTGNYFLPCVDAQTVAPDAAGLNVYLTVTMGSFVDYLIPNINATICDMLLSKKTYNYPNPTTFQYSYSKYSPLSNMYEAELRSVTAAPWYYLGGSSAGFTTDGRTQLSAWGSTYYSESGGCCQSEPGQEDIGWNQPYTITAWGMNMSHVFFKLEDYARFVYYGDDVTTLAQVVDIRGNAMSASSTMCWFNVVVDGVASSSTPSTNCAINVTISLVNKSSSTVSVYAYVSDASGFELRNPAPQTFTVTSVRPPTGATAVVQGTPIVSGLAFTPEGLPIGAIPVSYASTYMSYFAIGDSNLKPAKFQPMQAQVFYPTYKAYNWTWTPITAADGRFGAGAVNNMTLQFFAFALYSSSSQPIMYHSYCGDFCIIYIDGVQISLESNSRITAGWHQVVLKVFNQAVTGPNSGVSLWFTKANGIASSYALPISGPAGSIPLYPGEPFTSFLTPSKGPVVASSMNDNELVGNGVPDASVYPTRAMGGFIQVDNIDGFYPVIALDNPSAVDITLTYYSVAIYSTYSGTATFTMNPVSGSATVYFNGVVASATTYPLDPTNVIFGAALQSGWTQVLVKLSASKETGGDWTPGFNMHASDISGTVLFYASEIPDILPTGVTNFATSPLGAAMAAYSQNGSMYQIPYNFTSPTDPAAVDPMFTDVNIAIPDIHQNNAFVATSNNVSFYWDQMTASDPITGTFQNSADSGGYNRYYTFNLYASRSVVNASFSATFYAGFSMWVDGTFIGGWNHNVVNGSQLLTIPSLAAGYHQVYLKVQAKNAMSIIPVIDTANHNDASHVCFMRNLTICSTPADICPLGYPRPGFGIPRTGVNHFAAVGLGFGGSWVSIGMGPTAPCQLPMYNIPPANSTRYVACCGVTPPSRFSFSLASVVNNTGAILGWAPQRDEAPPAPQFQQTQLDGSTIVTITSSFGGALFYSLDGSYPATPYTKALTFTRFAFVSAIERYNNKDSPIGAILVNDPQTFYLSRTNCTSGSSCIVQVSKRVTPAAAYLAVLVSMSVNNTQLQKIVNSSFYVINTAGAASPYTRMMKLSDRGLISIDAPEVNFTLNARVVLFPPGADRFDITGILLQTVISDAPIVFASSSVTVVPNAPISVTGGFVGGDLYAFPQALGLMGPNDACSYQTCLSTLTNSKNWQFFRTSYVDNVYINVSSSYTGTKLTCMCYAGVGGTSLTSAQVMSLYGNDPVAPLSVNIDLVTPPYTSNSSRILSSGPDNVFPLGTLSIVGYFSNTPTVSLVCSGNVSLCSNASIPMVVVKTMLSSANSLSDGTYTLMTVIAQLDANQNYGLYTITVMDNGAIVPMAPGVASMSTAVVPDHPVVTSAEGPCATDSLSCSTGSIITFYGSNFVPNQMFNFVALVDPLTDADSTDVHCWVTSVNTTVLQCSLTVDLTAQFQGKLALDVVFRSLSAPWVDAFDGAEFPFSYYDTYNSIILNSPGASGWSGRVGPPASPTTAPTDTTMPTVTTLPPKKDGDDSPLTTTTIIVAAACGGVILILLIVGAIACIRYKFVPKAQAEDELTDVQAGWRGDENVPYSPIQADDA